MTSSVSLASVASVSTPLALVPGVALGVHVGWILVKILATVVPLLLGVAYLTLAERKVMASMQRRVGPNVVGVLGLLQPLADGLKLLIKETVLPASAHLTLFLAAPVLTLSLALAAWAALPVADQAVIADVDLGLLYLFGISSLGVYGIVVAGWASNSQYAFLGALRSAAQMVSYEVSLGLILLTVVLCAGTLNLTEVVQHQADVWYAVPLLPLAGLFFVSTLAETNRAPFDLPEAEAELVAGYNVEYSAMGFAMFFLGEYANMILMTSLTAVLFLGGWLSPLGAWDPLVLVTATALPGLWMGVKVAALLFGFIWVRAAFPRLRLDQLMRLMWKCYLPLALAFVPLVAGILLGFDGLPVLAA
jgi:NADH-quinone oxidoreductase subunit H